MDKGLYRGGERQYGSKVAVVNGPIEDLLACNP